MTSYHSVLEPFVPPPASMSRIIRTDDGERVAVKVRTRKLDDAPYYVFSVYLLHNDITPILQLISVPSDSDIADAIGRHHALAAKQEAAAAKLARAHHKETTDE